ncbi:MAG TPA: hypothetical protein PK423_05805 [Clostridiales bacterium]|nr:hypothetical protein [Clostridiales bacterium]HPZ05533.1 hypothetical protein [Clostridiales bacterium]HQD30425.1 hypothetical protein [Clostridiales bacterium]
MLLKAAFKLRNVLILAAVIFLTAVTASYLPGTPWVQLATGASGLAVYMAAVAGTLRSDDFRRELELSEKLEIISRLNRACEEQYRRISRRLGKKLREKVIGVLKQKEQLLHYFEKYREDPIKQRIIEQALKLVMAYLKLAGSFSERARELSPQRINELTARINANNRRLGRLKSYQAVLELTRTIEMDEKLLSRLKDEKRQLEMASVRFDQIESSIFSLKHRILSNDISDKESEEIQDAINEATALDNALNEQRRHRQRRSL